MAHLLAIVAGHPIPVDTPPTPPQAWRDQLGPEAPLTMGDGRGVGFESVAWGYNPPSSRLDQAIIATRRAVFPPELGLDPDF